MNQGLVIAVVALIAAVVIVRAAIGKSTGDGTKTLNRNALVKDERSEARQMLSETAEYRTSLGPQAALRAVEARFSATPGPGLLRRDIRLTEKTPTCLRYEVSNRTATFLETVVAASPWGDGSAVTFDVVRWLENDGTPSAAGNIKWIREDIEAVLRAGDPRLQVLIRVND